MQATKVIRAIEESSGLKWADILQLNRAQPVSDWRHIAAHLLRVKCEMTTLQVASIIERDHTTVIHATKKIQQLVGIDTKFSAKFAAVEKRLRFTPDTTRRPWRTQATYERARRVARPSWYRQQMDEYGTRDIAPIMTARTINRSTETEID